MRALYGHKSAGLTWRAALAEALAQLDSKSTKANPGVWIRAAVCPDGFKYYEMLCVYVNDILELSHKATEVITEITGLYNSKEGSINPPDIYLDTDSRQSRSMGIFLERIC